MEPLTRVRTPIEILVAIAVRLYRDGLAAALSAREHLHIAGTAGTAVEAQAAARLLQPDVLIVDVSLEDAIGLMRTARTESTNSRILAFAVREEINAILDYAQAGADGFVTANASIAELVEAIERTASGELLCSPRVAAQLLRRAAHQAPGTADTEVSHSLTARELQVFALLKHGQSNKEIAERLHIAEATVKNHVHRVLQKLQVSSRGQAIASNLPLKATLDRRGTRREAS